MGRGDPIDQSMFRFIWRYSRRDQVSILVIVLLSLPFYFLALDLPKTIVNKAIQGEGFEGGQSQSAFGIGLPALPPFWDNDVVLFGGFMLERVPFLVWMSLLFLALVIVNGLFKYTINTAKGRLGERMLRRLRFMLFDRILRFPPERYGGMRASELSTMIKDEVEPLGGFIGDAYVQPVFLGGQVITALAFIFLQNVWLGVVAGVIALIQALLIPRLRVPILALGRERQLTARALAGRIGDAVDGIAEIHVNGTSAYEGAAIGGLLGRIFTIRFSLYQKKFLVKFINNLLAQMTPFLFFLVGGYFAIMGRLDVGQLVAVIVAYKELPGPMKELIDWDLRRLDGAIKYEQVVSQFAAAKPVPVGPQQTKETDIGLGASLEIADLAIAENDQALIDPLTITLPLVGATGMSGAGAGALLETLARLRMPERGAIRFGGRTLAEIPAPCLARDISYVGETVHLGGGTVFDTLAYGLFHAPPQAPDDATVREARRTGNPVSGAEGDWIDYARAGAATPDALKAAMIDVMAVVECKADLYSWGLNHPVDTLIDAPRMMRARRLVADSMQRSGWTNLVERFDIDAYNRNASIGENIVFGAVSGAPFGQGNLASNDYMLSVMRASGMHDALIETGREIGAIMVEIFAGLSPDNPLVEQFSVVSGEELPDLKDTLARKTMTQGDRFRLLALAFRYCEVRHRLDLMTPALEAGILKARALFRSGLPEDQRDAVSFYDPERPTTGALMIDDILFGKIVGDAAHARERIEALVHDVLDAEGLLDVVLEAGLSSETGNRARHLSTSQKQRLAVARALLRRPRLLLINRALATLDSVQEARIMENIIRHLEGRAVMASLGSIISDDVFDRHVVLGKSGSQRQAREGHDGIE